MVCRVSRGIKLFPRSNSLKFFSLPFKTENVSLKGGIFIEPNEKAASVRSTLIMKY